MKQHSKKLMIVESHSQAEKMSEVLGEEWDVIGYGGHIDAKYDVIVIAFQWSSDFPDLTGRYVRYTAKMRDHLNPGCDNGLIVL